MRQSENRRRTNRRVPRSGLLAGTLAGEAQGRKRARSQPAKPNRPIAGSTLPVLPRTDRFQGHPDLGQLLLLRSLPRVVHLPLRERIDPGEAPDRLIEIHGLRALGCCVHRSHEAVLLSDELQAEGFDLRVGQLIGFGGHVQARIPRGGVGSSHDSAVHLVRGVFHPEHVAPRGPRKVLVVRGDAARGWEPSRNGDEAGVS